MDQEKRAERIPPGLVIGFGLVFLALVLAGIFLYRGQQARLRREALTTLESIAELKTRQIVEWREDGLKDAADDAGNPQALRLLRQWFTAPTPEGGGDLLAYLGFIQNNYGYHEVRLVDPAGQPLLSTSAQPETTDEEVRDALQEAFRTRRPVLTRFHIRAGDPGPHIGAVVPIFALGPSDAPPLGAVISTIDPADYLYPLIESWPTPSPSAETLLVTRDGEDVLFLNELRHRKDTALKLRIPLQQDTIPAVMAVQGRTGVVEGPDYRGIPVLSTLKKVPGSDWFIVSKVDRIEVFAGWRLQAALIITLILAMIAAAAAAFLMFWQRGVKSHYRALHEAESARDLSESRYRTTLISIGDGVIVTDTAGKIVFINPTAERLTGWDRHEARGLPLEQVFKIINEDTRLAVENPAQRVLREGLVVGLANHTLLLSRDGREIPIADSGAPIRPKDGAISGVVLVFSDQGAERRVEQEIRRNEARLRTLVEILQHPAASVQEYLDHALDEAIRLSGSKIGYIYHYHEDRREFVLNSWSRDVMKECAIPHPPTVYALEATGIWGEAVRQRRPIILNDFQAENPLKKGYPEGHVKLARFMTVPVFKEGKIIAVVGVANKDIDYSDADVLQMSLLMEAVWRVVDRLKAEEALRLSEERFRLLYEKLPLGYQSLDAEGRFLDVNQTWLDLLGYAREDVLGRSFGDFLVPEQRNVFREKFRRFKEQGVVHDVEYRMKRKDGGLVTVMFDGRIGYDAQMRFKQTHCLLADISERVLMEQRLRESEKKFRSVFDAANVGKSLTLPGGAVVPNTALCRMLGYSAEELGRKRWQDITPPDEVPAIEMLLDSLLKGEQDEARFEKRYVRKDGTELWGDVSTIMIRDEAGNPLHFITTVIDISQRKDAERRLEALSVRQRAMLAAIPDIIMEVDRDKIYTWANRAGLEFFGPEVVGRSADFYFEGDQSTFDTVRPLFNGDEDIIYVESRQRRSDGEKRLLAWWCRVLKDAEGRVIGALSSGRDVTEQKAAEEKIRQSLKEREVMLREIHHRVKNNLQIVSSLLRLQSRRLDDAKAKAALADSQNRIRSMALIHEKLYQTGDFAQIEMGDYFEGMGTHLLSAFREFSGRVTLRVEARDILLDINRAIPVGLIVNELVTNALKHAFPAGREGGILTRLVRIEEDRFELKVKDDGIGFPEAALGEDQNSFGLEIVRDLTRQIDGTLEMRNNGGTEIVIRF